MLATLTSFLNRSLAVDMKGKADKCEKDCEMLCVMFPFLLSTAVFWPVLA